ncbi:MAG: hypothetical protein FJ291_15770 [Planctomycetes bacterium]|nr:hypothetical protein [Planctomycetota bacterium]
MAAAEAARGRTADDVLRELEGQVAPEPAEEAAPEAPVDPNLGRHLLAEGPVTREFIQQQLTVSGKADSYLGHILARVRAPAEAKLYRLLAGGYEMPQVDLKQCKIPMAVARSVPADTLRKYKMLPIEQIGDLLCVAFSGEPNPKAAEAIRKATGLRVKALGCPPHHIEILLRRLLREVAVAQVVAAVPIPEADYDEALRGPEPRWESIHASRGPLRAVRLA